MLAITKSTRNPLQQFCREQNACYDNMPTETRETLKASLLEEQGYLCAYCMKRITLQNMHIEHWFPQNPSEEPVGEEAINAHRLKCIDYKNLLAVCSGGTGKPQQEQHCDTHKNNALLTYNPSEPRHKERLGIWYSKTSGEISSSDENFDKELNDVLNLNIGYLKNNRKDVISYVNQALDKLKSRATKDDLNNLLNSYQEKNADGKFKEYAGIAIYYLQKRLRACA